MADPSFNVAAAVGLASNITKHGSAICKFVLKVQDAQKELELVRVELDSAKKALEFLVSRGAGSRPQNMTP
jgi:hypothetical protein